MKFKRGERVLVMGNAYGMNIQNVKWPLKAVIHVEGRCNIPANDPAAFPGSQCQEYYQVIIDDPTWQTELHRQGYYAPGRWNYPVSLLRRDKYCPVCNTTVETYSDRNLIAEHGTNGERCYGSHSPLEL